MAEDLIALSQEEIDKVLNNVRSDNAQHDKEEKEHGVALSQDELDRLLGGAGIPFKMPQAQSPAQEEQASSPQKEESRAAVTKSPESPASDVSPEDAKAAKIAERKERMAQMLAAAKASAPRRISVVYGNALKTGAEIDALKEGSLLELSRATVELADILVDGELYARGKLGSVNGQAAIKITQIL